MARVTGLWRYPVKSMQGEALDRGDDRDRSASSVIASGRVVDVETGLALTARRQPELLFASAALDGDDVVITLPDGTDDRRRRASLSAWLGHAVALTRADAVDHGTYEIALDFENEDTAEWFQWEGPDVELPRLDPHPGVDHRRRTRSATGTSAGSAPTSLVDGARRGRLDRLARSGVGAATLDIVKPIDRCVITTRPQPGGIDRDLDVLRTVNRDRDGNLGIGAMVTATGRVAVGDEIPAA